MILSTSNVLSGVIPTIDTGDSGQDARSIVDPDFSTSYTSNNNQALVISFGAVQSISYFALAGINIKGNMNNTSYVQLLDGATAITSNTVVRDNCIMLVFAAQSFSNLRIALVNALGDTLPTVHYVAAGDYLEIPLGGENAGYNRQFLNRNTKTKSTLSQMSAPTSVLNKKTAPKGKLTLPNMTKEFSENEWQRFLDFSEYNYFFIVEQDEIAEVTANSSAYLCYEVTNTKTTAHAQTRGLNNISIGFKVFTGL